MVVNFYLNKSNFKVKQMDSIFKSWCTGWSGINCSKFCTSYIFEAFTLESPFCTKVRQRLLSTTIAINENLCCEWIKYSLLSSWKWLHVTATVCGRTERITQWPSCRQMFLTSLSHQTSYLTHPIQIPWITQFWSLTAAGILSEGQGRWPSETSPEQLLGDDQRRTDQQWPVV